MTVVGTRPEIIRLSRVIPALDNTFEHILVHTGQNYDYELNQIFFEDLSLRKPDFFLKAAGKNSAETVGNIISKMDSLLEKIQPDALLILGDTNSCLAAYPAKRKKIPVFHMEAGNRCFDQTVPEEVNRKIVDHLADINLPYSDIAREYLLHEGISVDRIIKTGSPMCEVLSYYYPKSIKSKILDNLSLKEKDYYVFSSHREENIESSIQFKELVKTLNGLAKEQGKRIIFTTHPRTLKKLKTEKIVLPKLVELHKPFNLTDYLRLQGFAIATLSDSGTISEESSILNFPALNIRNAHERPEAMEEASVMMVGMKWKNIKKALDILKNQKRGTQRTLFTPHDYAVFNVSQKIVRIILSYTDYVKRKVYGESV